MNNKADGKTISQNNVTKIADDLDMRVGSKLSNLRCCIVAALDGIKKDEEAGNDESAGITAIAFLNLFCEVVERADEELIHMTNIIRQIAT